MRISDWSSDVCSSDLNAAENVHEIAVVASIHSNNVFGCEPDNHATLTEKCSLIFPITFTQSDHEKALSTLSRVSVGTSDGLDIIPIRPGMRCAQHGTSTASHCGYDPASEVDRKSVV